MKCRISLGATRPLGNEGVLDETGAISHRVYKQSERSGNQFPTGDINRLVKEDE